MGATLVLDAKNLTQVLLAVLITKQVTVAYDIFDASQNPWMVEEITLSLIL
jgi:hypothetical protein